MYGQRSSNAIAEFIIQTLKKCFISFQLYCETRFEKFLKPYIPILVLEMTRPFGDRALKIKSALV